MRNAHVASIALGMTLMASGTYAQDVPRATSHQPSPRIVGGVPVADDTYPFMASIQILPLGRDAIERHSCGGSLISPWHVLTAAHCVAGIREKDLGKMSVLVGRTVLSDESQGETRGINAIRSHPKYMKEQGYDVAVVELTMPVNTITPAQRPTPGADALERPGRLLTTIGWGNMNAQDPALPAGAGGSRTPDRLQEVQLPVVASMECQLAYEGSIVTIDPQLDLCAGRGGKDACQGDSGGPIFASMPGNRQVIQLGVVSRGQGCAAKGYPGVFTRLANPQIAAFIANPYEYGSDS